MLVGRTRGLPESSVTDERARVAWRERPEAAGRRAFLRVALGLATGIAGLGAPRKLHAAQGAIEGARSSAFSTTEPLTSLDAITQYNNFYEFGPEKSDPARHAHAMTIAPWRIRVEGHVEGGSADYHVDDLVRMSALEERIYRLRCVEGWSMVIPWIGVPLGDVLRRLRPRSTARFVVFETAARTGEMPGLRSSVLSWPYVEALRLDEALHPLTLLAVGLYGRTLLNQNGAPIRLVVPWKYGFKSIKSIVRIRLLDRQPPTAWSRAVPGDFGFYANVNPAVHRPRDQRMERRIGHFFQQRTQPFNGYGGQVAHLYEGMDLVRDF